MEVEELSGTEMRKTQLLTVRLYPADREENFVHKQRDVCNKPINASDTTVNCLGTELHIHTHTYMSI
jgi:hypothetical protein